MPYLAAASDYAARAARPVHVAVARETRASTSPRVPRTQRRVDAAKRSMTAFSSRCDPLPGLQASAAAGLDALFPEAEKPEAATGSG